MPAKKAPTRAKKQAKVTKPATPTALALKALERIAKHEKESGLSEDNYKRALDNIQELTDEYIKKINSLVEVKEKDLLN